VWEQVRTRDRAVAVANHGSEETRVLVETEGEVAIV
jgi:hypothetical protein